MIFPYSQVRNCFILWICVFWDIFVFCRDNAVANCAFCLGFGEDEGKNERGLQ
jgi:hypothetical protein